jgi:hypothetical protein
MIDLRLNICSRSNLLRYPSGINGLWGQCKAVCSLPLWHINRNRGLRTAPPLPKKSHWFSSYNGYTTGVIYSTCECAVGLEHRSCIFCYMGIIWLYLRDPSSNTRTVQVRNKLLRLSDFTLAARFTIRKVGPRSIYNTWIRLHYFWYSPTLLSLLRN